MKKISKLLCLLLICSVLAVTVSVAALSDNEYEAEVSMTETNPAAVDDAADDETPPVDVTEEIVDDVLISCSSTLRIMDDSNLILIAERPADVPGFWGQPTAIYLCVPEGENRDEYLAKYTEEQLNEFRRMVGAPEVATESKASSGLLYNDGDIVGKEYRVGNLVNLIAYRVATVYTPNGTAVQVFEALQDFSDEFKAQCYAEDQESYPNAQRIGDATACYN